MLSCKSIKKLNKNGGKDGKNTDNKPQAMFSVKITLKYRNVRNSTGRVRSVVGGLTIVTPYGVTYTSYVGLCDDVMMEVDTYEDLAVLLKDPRPLYAAVEHTRRMPPVIWLSHNRAQCITDENAVCLPICVRGVSNAVAIQKLEDFEDETATCNSIAGLPVEFTTSR